MIVDGVMYYLVVPLLGVLCSCDDGPLFSCLKWEKYYLFCGVFVPSSFCFVHFGVVVIFKYECCIKAVVFI